MNGLFLFPGALKCDPAVEVWMQDHEGVLGAIARHWFNILRGCGDDVHEILHDGHPTACVDEAAFAYVDAFKAHANIGFYRGAEIADPQHLLQGAGKLMRHVKLRPAADVDGEALKLLIEAAYADMKQRLKDDDTRRTR